MAQNLRFSNNSWGTLASGIISTDTAIALTAGQGARFPALTAGQFFYATLSTAANVLEIVKVTARAIDALTVVRAQDNTTASAFSLADRLELRPCAAAFDAMAQSADPTFTGSITTPLTASRAVATNASSVLAASATTATELGYVNGVTSAIQTQMNLKAPAADPTFTGTVALPATVSVGGVTLLPTGAELNFVDGVTSAIQTQMNLKAPLASPTFSGTLTTVGTALSGITVNTGNWYRSATSGTGWFHDVHTVGLYSTTNGYLQTYNIVNFLVTGTTLCTGDVFAFYSDMRLKDKIAPLDNALTKIKLLDTFTYRQNALGDKLYGKVDERVRVGVSAQQVQAVLPEAVSLAPFDIEPTEGRVDVSKSGENYMTVQYERLVPLLIAGIQELSAEVALLRMAQKVK